MDPGCPHLSFTSFSFTSVSVGDDDRRIVLVLLIDALRLCTKGEFERVSDWITLWEFEQQSQRLAWQLRAFAVASRLVSPYSTRFGDEDVIQTVAQAIHRGELVGLRKGHAIATVTDALAEQRHLVRQIDAKTRGRLNDAGRQFKLIPGADLSGTPDRDSFEVVAHDDANRTLDRIGRKPSMAGDLASLLGKASEGLSPDWRPPLAPNGLVLLRRIRAHQAASTNQEAAISPSQLRAMIDNAALEIHVVDLNQQPKEGVAFKIDMPDGGSVSGKLDKDGRGQAKSSSPGVFVVTFPELDGADWDGDGALALSPEKERGEVSRYKVEQGDRLPTIARKKGFARWQTIWSFAGNAGLRGLRNAHILFPGDEVSIPSKLARVAQVQGGKAEYVLQISPEMLRVRFAEAEENEEPIMFRATPDAGDDLFEGELAADGTMEIDLPPNATQVSVELFCGDGDAPFVTYQLDLGGLDPRTEITGVQARLANLGYYDGEIDGDLGNVTKGAIVRFRREYGLPLSDEVDDDLRNALAWVHDDDDDTGDCEADHTTPENSAVSEDAASDVDDESADESSDEVENDADTDPVEWDNDDWEDEDDIDNSDGTEKDDDTDADGEVTP
jgi:N-acetylmuramoyl-L-alanine amidase